VQPADALDRWLRVLTERSAEDLFLVAKKHGSFTLEESLAQLVRKGLITIEDARTRTVHTEELEGLMR